MCCIDVIGSYAGLDGNTSAQERERLINRFNAPENTDVLLFMLSTRYAMSPLLF